MCVKYLRNILKIACDGVFETGKTGSLSCLAAVQQPVDSQFCVLPTLVYFFGGGFNSDWTALPKKQAKKQKKKKKYYCTYQLTGASNISFTVKQQDWSHKYSDIPSWTGLIDLARTWMSAPAGAQDPLKPQSVQADGGERRCVPRASSVTLWLSEDEASAMVVVVVVVGAKRTRDPQMKALFRGFTWKIKD